jgi:hypothetical protein
MYEVVRMLEQNDGPDRRAIVGDSNPPAINETQDSMILESPSASKGYRVSFPPNTPADPEKTGYPDRGLWRDL